MILHPRGYLAMSEDISDCYNWRGRELLLALTEEAKDAAEHPAMHRTDPHNKELSCPKCQSCQGWELLINET
jgi:hypothetical protein